MPVRTGETYNFSSDLNSQWDKPETQKYRGLPHWSCRHQKDLVINYRLYLLKYRLAVHIHHTFGPVSMLICLHSTDFTTIVVPTVTPIIQREIHGFRQRGIFPVTESCLVTLSISVCYKRRRRAAIHDMKRHAIHIYCILAVYKSCREFSGPEIPLVTMPNSPSSRV